MGIEYLVGAKREFYDFINFITHRDKVAIVTHIDLDGLASGLFLEKILEAKNIPVDYIDFITINSDMVKEVSIKLNAIGITKVFFCDLGIDSIDPDGFLDLKNEMDVFLIDHHPLNVDFSDKRNIIKTGTDDCSAMTIFDLGTGIFDMDSWRWLNCAAIFSDYSYKKKENFDYLKSVYPELDLDNISSSVPGINARKIASALIYYEYNKRYVYDLVKQRKLEELNEIHEIIEEEVNRLIEEFPLKKEYSEKQDLYFYELDSKFNVVSLVSTLISKMKPQSSFVFMQRWGDVVKFSARNQSNNRDMGALMKACVAGFVDASGGGHAPAAAAKIKEGDLEEFKMRLLGTE
jgi:single-stranded DNA-specific DHH superfamily exonuclease